MSDAISRLRELRAKATKGPWLDNDHYQCVQGGDKDTLTAVCYYGKGTADTIDANMALIVAMHTALPLLLDVAESVADKGNHSDCCDYLADGFTLADCDCELRWPARHVAALKGSKI